MDIELARAMVRTAFESGALLQQMLVPLKAQCSPQDYQRHIHDIAVAIDTVNTALVTPALTAHPSLKAEIDNSIRMTGRYRLQPNDAT